MTVSALSRRLSGSRCCGDLIPKAALCWWRILLGGPGSWPWVGSRDVALGAVGNSLRPVLVTLRRGGVGLGVGEPHEDSHDLPGVTKGWCSTGVPTVFTETLLTLQS